MAPSIVQDGLKFFPNVLKEKDFQKKGILAGAEPGGKAALICGGSLHWTVIDPRKHELFVWAKKEPDFVDAAAALGSSVVTNGSFNIYNGNRPGWQAHLWYNLEVAWAAAKYAFWFPKLFFHKVKQFRMKYFGNSTPQGFVLGAREGISETTLPRPALHHFGRKAGRQFGNYAIALGNPTGYTEAIGGLFPTVSNFLLGNDSNDTNKQTNDFGYWGLAPLSLQDPKFAFAQLAEAMELLQQSDHGTDPTLAPMEGVLLTVFYGGSTQDLAKILIGVGVKDAVRIDGSDSVLYGHGSSITVGKNMPMAKRLYNKWGFQCRSG